MAKPKQPRSPASTTRSSAWRLADDAADWRPNQDGYDRWGFSTHTVFPVVKLLDYVSRMEALATDRNPFATVVLAHFRTLQTRRDPADRHAWKLRLAKGLFERGLDARDVRQHFRFIDWLMSLPEPLEQLFLQEFIEYQEAKQMPFIDIIERVGLEKGLLKGIEECLDIRFGEPGLELMPELRELQDHELLEAVLRAIKTAAKPQDLRRIWARARRSKKAPPSR